MILGPGELEELHFLRRRAYGRDGALTAAEARRLQELEDRRVARGPEQDPVPSAPADQGIEAFDVHADDTDLEDAPTKAEPDQESEPGQESDSGEESEPGEHVAPKPSELRALLRAGWRPLALAAALAIVLGLGVGWLVFSGPGIAAVPLTAEQQKWQAELIASGDYDAGSIRALAVEDGVVVWWATKDNAQRTCLVLGNADMTFPNCDETASANENGLFGSFTASNPDGSQSQIGAQMLRTTTGEPAVAVSSFVIDDPSSSSFSYQYGTDEEVETAEQLVSAGYDPTSIWIVGYDNDVPIWRAMETGTQSQCLIYDGSTQDAPFVCVEPEMMQDQEGRLILDVLDAETGVSTRYEWQSNSMSENLIIERGGAPASTLGMGDSFAVDGPPGDPIQVEVPGRSADG
ncbi:hypothetical protein AB0O87_12830 [Microbacterium sp. NPDC076768]|uniref:hypothetical protein n=1 Tax=Microbacterium sp. NPDC076768 TaxID=3154858 RepID=UPI00343CA890